MPEFTLASATPDNREIAERLWLMFRHDLSEFRGVLPNSDGSFRSERLTAAFDDPNWVANIIATDDVPIGLALVRGLLDDHRVLSAFFIVRGARRRGVGLQAVHELIARHPGRWEIPFQDDNRAAVAFWHRVATEIAGDEWVESRHRVPDRPDLPPDLWISFTA